MNNIVLFSLFLYFVVTSIAARMLTFRYMRRCFFLHVSLLIVHALPLITAGVHVHHPTLPLAMPQHSSLASWVSPLP